MAQYAILIYAPDSAHAPDATPQDIETCDRHSDEMVESGVQLAAYALLSRLGRSAEAAAAYRQALDLTANEAERAFLTARLDGMACADI